MCASGGGELVAVTIRRDPIQWAAGGIDEKRPAQPGVSARDAIGAWFVNFDNGQL